MYDTLIDLSAFFAIVSLGFLAYFIVKKAETIRSHSIHHLSKSEREMLRSIENKIAVSIVMVCFSVSILIALNFIFKPL